MPPAVALRGVQFRPATAAAAKDPFRPWPQGCTPPLGANPHHLQGRWLRQGDWPRFQAEKLDAVWQPIARSAWLAPARVTPAELWTANRFADWQAANPGIGHVLTPTCLRLEATGDVTRLPGFDAVAHRANQH